VEFVSAFYFCTVGNRAKIEKMIGFIGLGNMGGPMARNLMKKGHKLLVYDALADKAQEFKAEGATIASSPADVAAGTKKIVTMLPSSPHVREVYSGAKGLFQKIQPGTLCMDSSTIDPDVSRAIAGETNLKSAVYLDSPVSGGVAAAQGALLTFMVGGDESGYKEAVPILECMGKNIVYCGASGNGQAAKICNNMLLAICMIGTSEAFNLGQKLGLDAQLLAKIINTSSGRNWSSELYNPVPGVLPNAPASRKYEGGFGASLMLKDLGLAQNAATSAQVSIPLGSLSYQLYRLLVQSPRFQTKDFSSIYQFLSENQ